MRELLAKLFGGLFGASSGGSIASKGMDLIAERTEDIDKRNAAIVELTKLQMELEANPVWLRALAHWPTLTWGARAALGVMIWASALHIFSRTAIVIVCVVVYAQQPNADLNELLPMALGGAYILMKGKGK